MDIRKVDDTFAVAPQIQASDMQTLADAGYTTVMCNRPDDEEPSQPPLSEIVAAAKAAGLEFHHVPVSGGMFPQEALEEFARVRKESPGPVLAYCRSGTRCMTMEALANPMGLSVDERLERAAEAGYDLSGMRSFLS
ncbi:TIGR01244 family sulfur transferase [Aurantiacibacter sp. D1-12]|uniref:TIGR01244 family sulfur transferase n=1 Tax=Aurantiacibacter sp. D1-12 TaxID=2993658 RepID=UPI00237C688B|nr:TIGR01244 family sulfur transferase [Aurantiacibacter sp. D1-12]MDE1467545.1 TIGR01244 family sulfur transferase [Aurantiacibacter sp. D1-12]